jgi:hypothetical protein
MTKQQEQRVKDIQKEIKNIDFLISQTDTISERNSKAYNANQNELKEKLVSMLKDAGFPEATIDLGWWRYGEQIPQVTATFYKKDFNTIEVEWNGRIVKEIKISSIGARGEVGLAAIGEIEEYLNIAKTVMEKLSNKFCQSNLNSFFETAKNWKEPKLETWEGTSKYELNEKKRVLEDELRILELDLVPGKVLEYHFESNTKWRNDRWEEIEIVDTTSKRFTYKTPGSHNQYTETRKLDYRRFRTLEEAAKEKKERAARFDRLRNS